MANKPPRSVELAKMAAEAARAEVEETEPKPTAPQQWRPATLQGFHLQPAMDKAVKQVAGHLARALHHEGLDVVVPAVTQTPHTPIQAAVSSPEAQNIVQVQEGNGGRLVRGYSTPAVLGLFASQQQRNGIVVDGQI